MCGLFGCNSVFSCIYGECSKQKDGVPCGNMKGARWVKGPNRTINTCLAHHTEWMSETGGDPSKLKFYASCQYPPIPIYHSSKNNVPILLLYPIAPLHLLLGVGNDALKCMGVIWSETGVIEDFYKYNGFRRGNTTGGEFTGKVNVTHI